MTHTDVVLSDSDGVLTPSPDSVRVAAGDTIAFSVANGREGFAFFSPDAASVLSPRPANPCPITAGGKAHFSFTSSQAGAYSAYFGYAASDAPDGFPGAHSEMLELEIDGSDSPPFGGPSDNVGSGHSG